MVALPCKHCMDRSRLGGRWGFNFEVGNFFTLDNYGYNPNGDIFTILGAEWSRETIIPQVSDTREMLWAAVRTLHEVK